MKMALPPKKDVVYIRKKLKIWFEANRTNPKYPSSMEHELKRALLRLCSFFNVPMPHIEFYNTFGEVNCKILGQCTEQGIIKILLPSRYPNFTRWCSTLFHEFGHYIYYANAEKKADEFEKRMMDRW